jgi:ATP-dependent helicase HrpB
VVLATSIAETSLTIEGVRVVVDGGRMRVARFDPGSGMTRLVTLPVSRAGADQRRGRAGRLGPGVCYRLWSEADDRALLPFTSPEMTEADLAPLALDLAQWGVRDTETLCWLDPPPAAHLAQARDLLRELGALDESLRITSHGKAMVRLGLHPRLAHMVLRGRDLGMGGLASDLAALLEERDVLRMGRDGRDGDLRLRLDALRGEERGLPVDKGALSRARQAARDVRRRLGLRAGEQQGERGDTGLLLAFAYPDRIARRRPGGEPRYAMTGGGGAVFASHEPLAAQEWLALAETDGDRREARIFLAVPLTLAEIEEHFDSDIRAETVCRWDGREEVVQARARRVLWSLVLEDKPLKAADPQALAAAMAEGVRQMGLACLPWTPELERLGRRVAFVRGLEHPAPNMAQDAPAAIEAAAKLAEASTRRGTNINPDGGWPDLSEAALLGGLEDWLVPYLAGITRRAHLTRLDLGVALGGLLSWEQKKRLDDLAPTHVEVPSGSRVPIDYSGEVPVLAVRLQEMFGCAETPRIGGGKVALLLHLLSPARRPMQVTRDLASFWANTYKQVKADLKGQYPKHWWPDDPMQAEPTARIKPRK